MVRDAGGARVYNSFGSIELAGAAGNVTINANNGSVQAADVKGTLEVHNRFGSITTRNIQGAATINGGNGTVSLIEAASANITTSFGSVEARNIRGDLLVRDNNGNVEFSNIGGSPDNTNNFWKTTFFHLRRPVNFVTNNAPGYR